MVIKTIERRHLSNFDWQLLLSMLLLSAIGLGLLYSAGYSPETKTSFPMNRQMAAMGGGLVVFLVCALVDTSVWRRYAFVFYVLGCIALVVLLSKGITAHGAKRWLAVGGLRFQPSEFMKLGLILAMARVFSSESAPKGGYTLVTLFWPCLVAGVPIFLTLIQPDLGTALSQVLIAGSMLLLAGVKRKTLFRLSIIGAIAAYPAWISLKEYQKQRVISFLSPDQDPLGSGYHAIQSKIAVGSGMITGKGFLEGTQTQLRFLPEQTTDFIFSVLAEEWGFLGSATVLALYAFLIIHSLSVASRCPDRFSAFVVVGVAALVFWHVVINIGMVVGVLPVVGLTLPLLSFGGSSIVTVMAGLGLVAGVKMRRYLFT